jgi:dTDP-4-dehydrorhamnose 3,5-epimerase
VPEIEAGPIAGMWVFTPKQNGDDRGIFLEWYKADVVAQAVGRRIPLAQANHSVSRRGVVRGVHFALVPPGQAKYLYCPQGQIRYVSIDIRVGSPTFGQSVSTILDDVDRRAVYMAEGLGSAFTVLSETASLMYICSTPYTPTREFTVDPLDADLAIDWGIAEPVLSPRDAEAPSLKEAEAEGILPTWAACASWYERIQTLDAT